MCVRVTFPGQSQLREVGLGMRLCLCAYQLEGGWEGVGNQDQVLSKNCLNSDSDANYINCC